MIVTTHRNAGRVSQHRGDKRGWVTQIHGVERGASVFVPGLIGELGDEVEIVVIIYRKQQATP